MKSINHLKIKVVCILSLFMLIIGCKKDEPITPISISAFEEIKTDDWRSNIGKEYQVEGVLAESNGNYFLVSEAALEYLFMQLPEKEYVYLMVSSNIQANLDLSSYVGQIVQANGTLIENTNQNLSNEAFPNGLPLATIELIDVNHFEVIDPSIQYTVPPLIDICDYINCIPAQPQNYKYALLYTHTTRTHSVFYNEIRTMYNILIHNGYVAENIRVVFDSDLKSNDPDDLTPIHYEATNDGLNDAFQYLRDRMSPQDKFFLWIGGTAAGNTDPDYPYSYDELLPPLCDDTDGDESRMGRPTDIVDEVYGVIKDDEFAAQVNSLNFYDMIAFISAHHSGGLIWDLKGPNRVIMTSAEEGTLTWGGRDQFLFSDVAHHFFNALTQQDVYTGAPVSSDYNGDGFVSMYEAQLYIVANNSIEPSRPHYEDDNDGIGVALGDSLGFGANTFL